MLRHDAQIQNCRLIAAVSHKPWKTVTLPPKISKLTDGLHEDCRPVSRLFKIHMTSRITAVQSQDKKHTHSHHKFEIQRFQSIHKDDKTIASKGLHYGAVAREKIPREHTHERKHPLTKHFRSQHENQKRLFRPMRLSIEIAPCGPVEVGVHSASERR